MTYLKSAVLAAALAALATGAGAVSYTVNQSFGGGGVVGTIDTDGTIGTLNAGNITDWSLTLTDNSGSFLLDGATNSAVGVSGTAFSASATDLLFDFGAGSGYVLFQNPSLGSGINFWCIDNGGCINSFVPGQTVRTASAAGQVGALFSGTVTIASAGGVVVPMPASLPLMVAGLGGLMALRRSRRAAG